MIKCAIFTISWYIKIIYRNISSTVIYSSVSLQDIKLFNFIKCNKSMSKKKYKCRFLLINALKNLCTCQVPYWFISQLGVGRITIIGYLFLHDS